VESYLFTSEVKEKAASGAMLESAHQTEQQDGVFILSLETTEKPFKIKVTHISDFFSNFCFLILTFLQNVFFSNITDFITKCQNCSDISSFFTFLTFSQISYFFSYL